MKLTCNMTNVCKTQLSEENIEYLKGFIKRENNDKVKSFISNLISTEVSFSGDHYYNIPFEEIKEGDTLIADISELMTMAQRWEYIRVDHIYRDIIFYTILCDNVKEKECFCQRGSVFFSKEIYPCYIIKSKDYAIACDCPLVKVVDSEDEISEEYRIYDYMVRTKRDY